MSSDSPTSPAAGAPAPVPPKSGNRTLIIVLCVLLGLLLLVGGCVATCVYVVGKKAREYSAEAQKNPTMATITMLAKFTPNVDVVSKDEAANTITLRNKKTGEVVTLDLTQFTPENVDKAVEALSKGMGAAIAAQKGQGTPTPDVEPSASATISTSAQPSITPARASALAAAVKNLPPFVAAYPGSTTTAAATTTAGDATMGNYEFLTHDAPEKVAAYYTKKLTDAGMQIVTRATGTDDNGPTVSIISRDATSQKSVAIVVVVEQGRSKGNITFTAK